MFVWGQVTFLLYKGKLSPDAPSMCQLGKKKEKLSYGKMFSYGSAVPLNKFLGGERAQSFSHSKIFLLDLQFHCTIFLEGKS